jgi:hypothetical protein
MKNSTMLLLLASTAMGLHASSEEASSNVALMSPADIKAEIAQQINHASFVQMLMCSINECDQQHETSVVTIAEIIKDMANNLSEVELKEMLTHLLPRATEKAKTAQCENCTLVADTMEKTIIALEKNPLTPVVTADAEKVEELKADLNL